MDVREMTNKLRNLEIIDELYDKLYEAERARFDLANIVSHSEALQQFDKLNVYTAAILKSFTNIHEIIVKLLQAKKIIEERQEHPYIVIGAHSAKRFIETKRDIDEIFKMEPYKADEKLFGRMNGLVMCNARLSQLEADSANHEHVISKVVEFREFQEQNCVSEKKKAKQVAEKSNSEDDDDDFVKVELVRSPPN